MTESEKTDRVEKADPQASSVDITQVKAKYVTIWSRSLSGGAWVIERSHTEEYALALTGLRAGELAEINGRYYGVFEEGHNPNMAEVEIESHSLKFT